MKKLLLFFAMCASLSAWAQTANFGNATNGGTLSIDGTTDKTMVITGHGNLAEVGPIYGNYTFTDKAVNAVFTLEGENYQTVSASALASGDCYLLSNYTLVPVEGQPVTAISSKNYFVKNGDVYTNAFNTVYDENKTYATVTAVKLEGETLSSNITSGYFWTGAAVDAKVYDYDGENFTIVKEGELISKDTYYQAPNINNAQPASNLVTWQFWGGGANNGKYYGEQKSIFKVLDGIYTIENGSYSAITSPEYDSNKSYYTVTFNDLSDNSDVEAATQPATAIVVPDGASYFKFDGNDFVPVNDGDILDPSVSYYEEGESYIKHEFDWFVENGYMTATATPFWTYIMNMIKSNTSIKGVALKSETSTLAVIDNVIVRALLNSGVRSLDLSQTYMEEIKTPFPNFAAGDWTLDPNATFMLKDDGSDVLTLETLYTPQVKDGSTLAGATFYKLKNLRYLHISDGYKIFDKYAVKGDAGRLQLSVLTFPNTLEIIKEDACSWHYLQNGGVIKDLDGNVIPFIRTLVFPASLKVIEYHAFNMTCPRDVYFLGLEAPKVARHAWGDEGYWSNNTCELTAVDAGPKGVTAYLGEGYASRENYNSTNGYMCMLHYPAECTPAQAAKYTDPIRDYKRIDWDFERMLAEDDGDFYVNYNPGQETETIHTTATGTANLDAPKEFGNEYAPTMEYNALHERNEPIYVDAEGNIYREKDADGNPIYRNGLNEIVSADAKEAVNRPEFDPSKIDGEYFYDFKGNYGSNASATVGYNFNNGYFGGDYNGAYYDVILGDQYTWPSISMVQRATIIAQNNLTWDGVTTIGEQIKARLQDGETYEGDGSEYIGLHQFVFTSGDGIGGGKTTTNEWDLDKFADGKWHSICVPFDMTKRQMKETFGKKENDEDGNPVYDIRLCKFSDVIRNRDQVTLQFNDEQFDKAGVSDDDVVLHAHVSYMIWADANREFTQNANITFKNYVIKDGDPIVTKIMSHSDAEAEKDKAESIEYRFVGNYKKYHDSEQGTMARALVPVTIPQYSYYFSFSSQQFRFMQGDNTSPWNPYAAVVLLPEGVKDNNAYFETPASTSKVRTSLMGEMAEDEATTIEDVTIEINNEIVYTNSNVYNLKGQKVGNSIEGLSQGIYIVNGKKYFVK